MIEVSEPGRDIPFGDGSPVTMNIGDNVTAASNTTITIRCPVSGVPTPSAIWQKDGVEIGDENNETILDDNTLVIKEADLDDGAKYTCTIQNAFGKDDVSSIVRIIGKWSVVVRFSIPTGSQYLHQLTYIEKVQYSRTFCLFPKLSYKHCDVFLSLAGYHRYGIRKKILSLGFKSFVLQGTQYHWVLVQFDST